MRPETVELRSIRFCAALFAVLFFVPISSHAFSGGASVAGRSSTGCGSCHGSAVTDTVNVTISGATTIAPDSTEDYILRISPTTGIGSAFDVTLAGDGVLSTSAPGAQVVGDVDLVHSASARPNNVGLWNYAFSLAIGNLALGTELTLAAAGMQFNDEAGPGVEDIWNFANGVTITVVPEPATAAMLGLGLIGMAAARRRRL